jgi:hypothetical protein
MYQNMILSVLLNFVFLLFMIITRFGNLSKKKLILLMFLVLWLYLE